MTNKPKARGTAAETAVVRYLAAHGLAARRVAQTGTHDSGDIHLWDGKVVVEVKSRKVWASPAQIEAWLGELERECMNVPACSVGVLVVKRPGSGPANAGDWLCYLRSDEWALLHRWHTQPERAGEWVCVNLGHLAAVLAALPAGVL